MSAEPAPKAYSLHTNWRLNNLSASLDAVDARVGVLEAANLDSRLTTAESKIEEIFTDTGLSSRIDTLFSEKVNGAVFDNLVSNVDSNFATAKSLNNNQASVLNELVRYVKALAATMYVEEEDAGAPGTYIPVELDVAKLVDTTVSDYSTVAPA